MVHIPIIKKKHIHHNQTQTNITQYTYNIDQTQTNITQFTYNIKLKKPMLGYGDINDKQSF